MSILSVTQLSKNYGPIQALSNVNFEVPKGSVFGILGPNGSGKTTLPGIVMDVIKATSGNYLWNGQPGSNEQRKQIGTLLETPNFYHYLSGEKNLKIAAAIKERGKEDIPAVLGKVNLLQRKDSKFSTYSLGMKQRLAIASTLLGNPDILVFDEPTNGLDPAGIAEIRELMKELNRQGKTIIMASHILDEVEKVCTHVVILRKGEKLYSGRVDGMLASHGFFELKTDKAEALIAFLEAHPGFGVIKSEQGIITAILEEEMDAAILNRLVFAEGIVLSHLVKRKESLEEQFLTLTKNPMVQVGPKPTN
jgi:ABC-2 type transport system ATP-binding protein